MITMVMVELVFGFVHEELCSPNNGREGRLYSGQERRFIVSGNYIVIKNNGSYICIKYEIPSCEMNRSWVFVGLWSNVYHPRMYATSLLFTMNNLKPFRRTDTCI